MPLITHDTAAEMARKSHLSRKKVIEELRIAANPVPQPADTSYVERRLARVREQIERLSVMLETEEDAQKIDRLASALGRLSEMERQLANRPLPGSLKPSSPSRRQQTRIEPLPDEPSVPGTPSNSVPQAQQKPSTPQV